MQAYSLDLRERIVSSWQRGESKNSIAQRFVVSLSSVKRYIKRYEKHGNVHPTIQSRMQGKLTNRLRKRLAQHAELWQEAQHVQVSESTLSRALRRLGFTRKKKTVGQLNEVKRNGKHFGP